MASALIELVATLTSCPAGLANSERVAVPVYWLPPSWVNSAGIVANGGIEGWLAPFVWAGWITVCVVPIGATRLLVAVLDANAGDVLEGFMVGVKLGTEVRVRVAVKVAVGVGSAVTVLVGVEVSVVTCKEPPPTGG